MPFHVRTDDVVASNNAPILNLPEELLLQIASYGDKAEWQAMQKAHRRFCGVAEEMLYQSVVVPQTEEWSGFVVKSHHAGNTLGHNLCRLQLLERTLLARPKLAQLVQAISLEPVLFSKGNFTGFAALVSGQPCIRPTAIQSSELESTVRILQLVSRLQTLHLDCVSFAGLSPADPKRYVAHVDILDGLAAQNCFQHLKLWHIGHQRIHPEWFHLPSVNTIMIGSAWSPLSGTTISRPASNITSLSWTKSHWGFISPIPGSKECTQQAAAAGVLTGLPNLQDLHIEIDLDRFENGVLFEAIGDFWDHDTQLEQLGSFDVLLGPDSVPESIAANVRNLYVNLRQDHDVVLLPWMEPIGAGSFVPHTSLVHWASLRTLSIPMDAIIYRDFSPAPISRVIFAPLLPMTPSSLLPASLETLEVVYADTSIEAWLWELVSERLSFPVLTSVALRLGNQQDDQISWILVQGGEIDDIWMALHRVGITLEVYWDSRVWRGPCRKVSGIE